MQVSVSVLAGEARRLLLLLRQVQGKHVRISFEPLPMQPQPTCPPLPTTNVKGKVIIVDN